MKQTSEIEILGIPIEVDPFPESRQLNQIFADREFFTIGSLNPEIILMASKNAILKNALCQFDLNIVDGFGIQLVAFFKGMKIPKKITGADLSQKILDHAKAKKMKVGAVIRSDGWSSCQKVQKFFQSNEVDCEIYQKQLNEDDAMFIEKNLHKLSNANILFVFLGAPHQEKFLSLAKQKITGPSLGICAGGTIDFWTKQKKRAPIFLQAIGMEWAWRLIQQPDRFCRIWNSVVIFPIKALLK